VKIRALTFQQNQPRAVAQFSDHYDEIVDVGGDRIERHVDR